MHNRNELRLPNFKSDFGRTTIFHNGVKMFNEMPIETSIMKFRKMLLNYAKANVQY